MHFIFCLPKIFYIILFFPKLFELFLLYNFVVIYNIVEQNILFGYHIFYFLKKIFAYNNDKNNVPCDIYIMIINPAFQYIYLYITFLLFNFNIFHSY